MTPAEAMRAAITRVPSLVALDARDTVYAAAVTWRAAELAGLDVDSPRWWDLLASLRDAVDAAMSLGVDDDAPVGEIPPTFSDGWWTRSGSGTTAHGPSGGEITPTMPDWRHAVDAYRDARTTSGRVL